MADEELIGFHKGCIDTLVGERNALIEMINNVDKLMQMHLNDLRNLGVDVDAMIRQAQQSGQQQQQRPKKPQESEEYPEIYEQEERIA